MAARRKQYANKAEWLAAGVAHGFITREQAQNAMPTQNPQLQARSIANRQALFQGRQQQQTLGQMFQHLSRLERHIQGR